MKKKKFLKQFFVKSAIVNIVLFAGLLSFFAYKYNTTNLNVEALTSINNGIKVTSNTNTSTQFYNTNRSIVSIEDLPEYVKNAFVDTEDKRFYSHNGYDTRRIIKAALVNIVNNEKSQGASTISQQLIKNTILNNRKTYSRKLNELILSIKMEKIFTKEQILEMYLNTIYFGSGAYGISNASHYYFDKSADKLTPSEACTLAGIIKSPQYYNPITNADNATKRRNLVAKNMLELDHIDESTYNDIVNSKITIKQNRLNNAYEKEAIREACTLLNMEERDLINNGYEIITFKDDGLQQMTQQSLINKINNSCGENSTIDGLVVVVDNDGHVLSYATKSDYDLHDLQRQSASVLKPLAVYLPCFQHDILCPASQILDEPINYSGYTPENADKKYHGYVSVREAIAKSMNIPAVKALDYLGTKKAKSTLESLGINIEQKDLNLSLALGATSKGIKVLDLLNAYLTIENYGNKKYITFVDKILDNNGNIIYKSEDYGEQVIDEKDCYLLTSCLEDSVKYGTARRLNDLGLNIASKTGTASYEGGNTDLYNIAYSTEHCMITWIGDLTKKSLPNDLKSSALPTDINKEILRYLYSTNKPEEFRIPDGIEKFGYSQLELNENHRLILDSSSTLTDYFKSSNKPMNLAETTNEVLVNLSDTHATITCKANRKSSSSLIKKVKNKEYILTDNIDKDFDFIDTNIYSFEEIEYYTKSNDRINSNIVKLRPKDELLTKLNDQILTTKKKWQV